MYKQKITMKSPSNSCNKAKKQIVETNTVIKTKL